MTPGIFYKGQDLQGREGHPGRDLGSHQEIGHAQEIAQEDLHGIAQDRKRDRGESQGQGLEIGIEGHQERGQGHWKEVIQKGHLGAPLGVQREKMKIIPKNLTALKKSGNDNITLENNSSIHAFEFLSSGNTPCPNDYDAWIHWIPNKGVDLVAIKMCGIVEGCLWYFSNLKTPYNYSIELGISSWFQVSI